MKNCLESWNYCNWIKISLTSKCFNLPCAFILKICWKEMSLDLLLLSRPKLVRGAQLVDWESWLMSYQRSLWSWNKQCICWPLTMNTTRKNKLGIWRGMDLNMTETSRFTSLILSSNLEFTGVIMKELITSGSITRNCFQDPTMVKAPPLSQNKWSFLP